MAGAGYKLFNTGDVLTAAQVNTYLMQQTVMVFASSAARTSALSGVLAEGMVSYLQDSNTLEVYDGSAWVGATGDITGLTAGTGISISSATGPVPTITSDVATTFDAKGDLVVGTGADTFSKLTVGANGETIVADSSATTGLRWQGNYAAGKNKLINADFNVNQRAFTSTTTSGTFGFDRWYLQATDGTSTYSAQTFTAGTAPVAGYESTNFARLVSTGQTATSAQTTLRQKIEDVRTFANQTITLSFWAKASTGTPSVAAELVQDFGSGGSAAVTGTISSKQTISSSWARYTFTASVPSISGKTIGSGSNLQVLIWTSAGSDFNARTGTLGIQSVTIDIWGVQLEAGNTATAFQTATGTLAGELAACQRYYYRTTASSVYTFFCNGNAYSTTVATCILPLPVTLRTSPSSIETTGTASNYRLLNGSTATACSSVPTLDQAATQQLAINFTVASGLTAGQAINVSANNTASAYIGVSAEL